MPNLQFVIFQEGISLNLSPYIFYDSSNLHSVIMPSNVNYPNDFLFCRSNFERVFICSSTVKLTNANNNQFHQASRTPTIFVTKSYKGSTFLGVPVKYMEHEEYFCPYSNKNSCVCNRYLRISISLFLFFCIIL